MRVLTIIPARGGSKGIPHKNIKGLGNKPLIYYTIDVARGIVEDSDICVSTDDPAIIKCVENYGLKVPFVRPVELASDTAGTYEVLLHALGFYEARGFHYDVVLLLQTTSPFRTVEHVKEAMKLYRPDIDMVVSVNKTKTNPYYNCFEESAEGYLKKTLNGTSYARRQDAPVTYEYNGAIYIINAEQLKKMPLGNFSHIVKYLMDDLHSVDLDTMTDWKFAEFLINEGIN